MPRKTLMFKIKVILILRQMTRFMKSIVTNEKCNNILEEYYKKHVRNPTTCEK